MSDRPAGGNPTNEHVLEEIRLRWSPVCFDATPIEDETLRTLLEAARWAASCFNDQPWHFVIAPRSDRASFQRLLSCLVDANREWAQHAGALVLVVASKSFRHNGKPNRWSWFDCGQATAYLMLEAVHQGLRAHAMAGFDADAAHERCQLDVDQEAACFVAIGRHGELDEHSDALRERDAAENQRIELARVVSQGGMGEPSPVVGAPAAKH